MLNLAYSKKLESAQLTAAIVEWNSERGYGFLQHGTTRVFLHVRDFATRRRYPQIGDIIRFKLGRDAQGRTCAVDASQQNIDCRIPIGGLFLLVPLLALPALALIRFAPNPKILSGYVTVISILTWFAYFHDKKRAISGGWRVPESTLHFLELLGGWPAALLAQGCFRHKSSKRTFKFVFWLIVLLHQYIALDSLQQWKFTSAAISVAQQQISEQKQKPFSR